MSDETVTSHDPETGEIVDITPGAETPDALYSDPDGDYEYAAEAETWIGEPARVELRITPIDGQAKRFLLVEPGDETMDELIGAMLNGDQRGFCAGVVEEPALTPDRWQSALTGRERKLLFDHAFAWLRFGEFVTMQRQTE